MDSALRVLQQLLAGTERVLVDISQVGLMIAPVLAAM